MSDGTRVGIRGIAGLLGSRLTLEIIQNHPDIKITYGIAKFDKTLERFLYSPFRDTIGNIPLYLDEGKNKVREINELQQKIEFKPADELNLRKNCDILIDTAAPGSRQNWDQRYKHFGKPVIIQSGEYPHGRLISFPLIEEANKENIYRQGGCIISALSPILAPLQSVVKRIRVNVLMQYDQKLSDYPTNQITNATYLRDDLATIIEEELKHLLKKKEIKVDVLQKPSLDYYTLTLYLDTEKPLSGRKIKQILDGKPRIIIAPDSVTSTYEIDQMKERTRALGKDIPPIVLYSSDLNNPYSSKKDIRIRAAIYSKMIAVLPNIDTIRILAGKMTSLEAMKMTDYYAGFI